MQNEEFNTNIEFDNEQIKVAENETRIVLAASMGYSNTAHNAADFTSIIKSCIVKQRKLK